MGNYRKIGTHLHCIGTAFESAHAQTRRMQVNHVPSEQKFLAILFGEHIPNPFRLLPWGPWASMIRIHFFKANKASSASFEHDVVQPHQAMRPTRPPCVGDCLASACLDDDLLVQLRRILALHKQL